MVSQDHLQILYIFLVFLFFCIFFQWTKQKGKENHHICPGQMRQAVNGILYSIPAALIDIIQKMYSKQAFSKGKESGKETLPLMKGTRVRGLPRSIVVKKKNCLPMQETQVQSLAREDPLEKEMTTHASNSCLGSPVDRGAWWVIVHGATKESDTAERLSTHTRMRRLLLKTRKFVSIKNTLQ